MTEVKQENHAKEQAKAQLEGIVQLINRRNHIQDCTGEDCDLTDKEIYEGINLYYNEGDKATDEEREQYHDEENLRQTIDEDPLSIQVRTDWHTPGEDNGEIEYMILLCTGGPAVRIIGELDEHNQPCTAKLEHQDWFTPWTRYAPTSDEEDNALLSYAQNFYFGE